MLRKICLFFVLLPALGWAQEGGEIRTPIEDLAQGLSQELPDEGHFLVTNFQNELGQVTELGRLLSAHLRERISQDPNKKVVEDASLRHLIKSKLSRMGYIHHSMRWQPESPTPSEIEVHGMFTEFPSQLELRVRVLDSRTGDLKDNLAYRLPKTKDLYSMHSTIYDPLKSRSAKGKIPRFAKAYMSALFHLKDEKLEPLLSKDSLSNVYRLLSITREKDRNFDMAISLLKPYIKHDDNVIQSSVESFIGSLQKLKIANSEFIPLFDQIHTESGELIPAEQVRLLRGIQEMELLSDEFWDVALKSTVLMTHALLTTGSKGNQVLKMNALEKAQLIKEVDLMFPEIQGNAFESQRAPVQCAATIRRILVAFAPETRSVSQLMLKRKYFYIGLREYMKGNFAAAITGWKICLLIDPDHEVSKEKIRKAEKALREKKKRALNTSGRKR